MKEKFVKMDSEYDDVKIYLERIRTLKYSLRRGQRRSSLT